LVWATLTTGLCAGFTLNFLIDALSMLLGLPTEKDVWTNMAGALCFGAFAMVMGASVLKNVKRVREKVDV